MATLTIKSIPDKLYDRLKEKAAAEHRSINSEVIVCLERALVTTQRDPEAVLRRVRELRNSLRVPLLTDEFLDEAKREGRK